MWGKIIITMYRLWLNGLYGLHGPRCPLFSKRPINLISLSLSILCHSLNWRNCLQWWHRNIVHITVTLWGDSPLCEGNPWIFQIINSCEVTFELFMDYYYWNMSLHGVGLIWVVICWVEVIKSAADWELVNNKNTLQKYTVSASVTVNQSSGPFYQHGLMSIWAWINNNTHHKVWDKIIHPLPNFNGEVCEWTSYFIPLYWVCDYLSIYAYYILHYIRSL